ncbi:MAG: shikimate dehydrogenase [Burkholderiaceae bacterium]|nr:shikimate dehydrogenase [Burkholderiaceae bacterium]
MTSSPTPKARRCAVIGHPVAHSRSPDIHAQFARQTGLLLDYGRIEAPLDGFADSVHAFFESGGHGLNVTVPFKIEAWALARTHLTPRAAAAGAVNTLWRTDGVLKGCNTDGVGLLADLQRLGAWHDAIDVLLVGAGGAAQGVLCPLLAATEGRIHIVNRTAERALALAQTANSSRVSGGTLDRAARTGGWPLVINATASSLSGQAPDLPNRLYSTGSWAYDMMYGAQPTAFLLAAQADGASNLADGLGMLVGQAAESFLLWHGVRPDPAPVLDRLRAALNSP